MYSCNISVPSSACREGWKMHLQQLCCPWLSFSAASCSPSSSQQSYQTFQTVTLNNKVKPVWDCAVNHLPSIVIITFYGYQTLRGKLVPPIRGPGKGCNCLLYHCVWLYTVIRLTLKIQNTPSQRLSLRPAIFTVVFHGNSVPTTHLSLIPSSYNECCYSAQVNIACTISIKNEQES